MFNHVTASVYFSTFRAHNAVFSAQSFDYCISSVRHLRPADFSHKTWDRPERHAGLSDETPAVKISAGILPSSAVQRLFQTPLGLALPQRSMAGFVKIICLHRAGFRCRRTPKPRHDLVLTASDIVRRGADGTGSRCRMSSLITSVSSAGFTKAPVRHQQRSNARAETIL